MSNEKPSPNKATHGLPVFPSEPSPATQGGATSFLADVPLEEMPDVDSLFVVNAADPNVRMRVVLDGEITVGRGAGSRVVLDDEHASSKHARFVRDAGAWTVVDEGSRNGTFVNGKKTTGPTRLANGDMVRIGTTTFAFVSKDAGRTPASADDDLPYPIAVSARIIGHQTTPFARVKAILDAIETTLRVVVAIELAVVRDTMDAQAQESLANELANVQNVVRGVGLSMGDWVNLATRLAKIAKDGPDAKVAEVARALVARGRADELQKAVSFRNKQVGHGKILNELAFRDDAEPLQATFESLLAATRPLATHKLASVAEMQFKNAKVSYTLYALTGASDIFSTFRLESVAMLEKGWAYLVRADAPPLSLSPVLFADVTAETRKLEVFLAEGVILGPEGGKVPGRGATSNAGHEMELQWTDAAAALHSRVSAKRRGA